MLTTLNNDNKSTILLDCIKYPFPHQFVILIHKRLQCEILPTKEGVYILHLSGQEDVLNDISSKINVQKNPCCISYQPCRDWWKMLCMFPRVRYQYLEGMLCRGAELCLVPGLKLRLSNEDEHINILINTLLQGYKPQRTVVLSY